MDLRSKIIQDILTKMQGHITDGQQEELKNALHLCLNNYEVQERTTEITVADNSADGMLRRYIAVKRIEGLSETTLKRYYDLLYMMIHNIGRPLYEVDAYAIRYYLADYQERRKISNRTLDGMRKVINGFFAWLAKEDILPKNPCAAVSQIKYPKIIKKPYTATEMERIKQACTTLRDLALVEFLYASGCRVSEVASLNRSDINFLTREAVVMGKGSKERTIYLTPVAAMHLQDYLDSRQDDNQSLFASIKAPYKRLTKRAIEAALKRLGARAGVENVHPHRYRRTIATNMMDRGANIQDVATMLGHADIATTQIYCYVSQSNVRAAYNKYAA